MERKKFQPLGIYDYTVVATYLGMLFSVVAIYLAMENNFILGAIFLMLAGGCDMVDGAIASTKVRTKQAKNFGIQIDSLCDLISFGVMPGTFVYLYMGKGTFAAITSMVYILAALIRLAYFNVLEEERQEQTDEKRKQYLGIPVTSVSVVLPLVMILCAFGLFKTGAIFAVMAYALAIGFVAPLTIKKPGKIGKVVFALIGLVELILLIAVLAK